MLYGTRRGDPAPIAAADWDVLHVSEPMGPFGVALEVINQAETAIARWRTDPARARVVAVVDASAHFNLTFRLG